MCGSGEGLHPPRTPKLPPRALLVPGTWAARPVVVPKPPPPPSAQSRSTALGVESHGCADGGLSPTLFHLSSSRILLSCETVVAQPFPFRIRTYAPPPLLPRACFAGQVVVRGHAFPHGTPVSFRQWPCEVRGAKCGRLLVLPIARPMPLRHLSPYRSRARQLPEVGPSHAPGFTAPPTQPQPAARTVCGACACAGHKEPPSCAARRAPCRATRRTISQHAGAATAGECSFVRTRALSLRAPAAAYVRSLAAPPRPGLARPSTSSPSPVPRHRAVPPRHSSA